MTQYTTIQSIITLGFCFFTSAIMSASAQPPEEAADMIVNKQGQFGISRATPRTADFPGAYGAGNAVNLQLPPGINPTEAESNADENCTTCREPVGYVHQVLIASDVDGQWIKASDGGIIWTMQVAAEGAFGIRLRLVDWRPHPGGQLIVYNARNPQDSFGPFTRSDRAQSGNLWTPIIAGDTINIEYYLPPDADHLAPENAITIDRVDHIYKPLGSGGPSATPPVPCHLDVSCYADWQAAASGVATLYLVDTDQSFRCSGAMLNRIGGDLTPLFMTATHCGVTNANVDSMIVVWFYQSASCNGDNPPDWTTLPQQSAQIVLVRDIQTDWTLIGLKYRSQVPPGVSYLGWTSGTMDDDEFAAGIHHPRGSYKRISFGSKFQNNGLRPNPDGGLCIDGESYWVKYPNGSGEVEPGSSGSPLFDNQKRVRGTMSCGSADCTTESNAHYGRLDQIYTSLRPWLNPENPVYVNRAYGGVEIGTVTQPFRSVNRGYQAVVAGSTLHIQAGSYPESVTIDKPVTLVISGGTLVIGE